MSFFLIDVTKTQLKKFGQKLQAQEQGSGHLTRYLMNKYQPLFFTDLILA